ncbi:MAG TPA: TIGR03435 family protein [Bryobacteraceae bacterium]|nr:TIGR03435 family protein [Bryobacteraceae bacterium]
MLLGRSAISAFCRAVVSLLVALPAAAQSRAFAAITIRPDRSGGSRGMRMQVLPTGDLMANAVPVLALLSFAYDVPVNPSPRLSGLPVWTVRERYDIEAKASANTVPPGLAGSEVRGQAQQMIRGLLAGRFHLVMRIEQKMMSVYALSIAGGGPKLQKAAVTEKGCIFDTDPEGCHNFIAGFGHPLRAKAIDMRDLANYIANWTDLPVVNRTALSGLFAVNTEGWAPMRLPPPPPNATPPNATAQFAGLPTIFTVLGKLGLELKRQEDTLPVYTVEHIERPAAQ